MIRERLRSAWPQIVDGAKALVGGTAVLLFLVLLISMFEVLERLICLMGQ